MACARDGDVLLFHDLAGGWSDERSALYAKDAKAAHEAWMVGPAKDAVHVQAGMTPRGLVNHLIARPGAAQSLSRHWIEVRDR